MDYFALLLFTGDAFCNVLRSVFALSGTGSALLNTMSDALTSLPYRFLFAPLSGRSVEPSSEMPANKPREREYDKISARSVTSVSAEAVRPTGPAAADASAPSLTLLLSMFSADRGDIMSRTKSVAFPPSCKPALPPSSAIIVGPPQGPLKSLPPRQVITPRP